MYYQSNSNQFYINFRKLSHLFAKNIIQNHSKCFPIGDMPSFFSCGGGVSSPSLIKNCVGGGICGVGGSGGIGGGSGGGAPICIVDGGEPVTAIAAASAAASSSAATAAATAAAYSLSSLSVSDEVGGIAGIAQRRPSTSRSHASFSISGRG